MRSNVMIQQLKYMQEHLCFMARRAPKTVTHWRPRKPRRAFLRWAPRTGSSSSGATISSSDESSLAARPRFLPVTCRASNQMDVEPPCAKLPILSTIMLISEVRNQVYSFYCPQQITPSSLLLTGANINRAAATGEKPCTPCLA